METNQLQNKINDLLGRLGWSKNKAAKIIFMELYEDNDDPEDIKKFGKSFIKSLSRASTKSEKLTKYLRVLSMQKEVRKLDGILPSYQKTGQLSDFMENEMLKISKSINMPIK